MVKEAKNVVVGLDIGTSKIVAIVAEIAPDGAFDDVLGRLANLSSLSAGVSRTAYLHVNYRAVVPVGKALTWDGAIERTEGRKMFTTGRLLDGDKVLADADLLFVALKPGQP